MKRMVISPLLFILFISLSSALTFTISSPEEAEINETLSVSISAATTDIYDVKITITDNSSQKIISQIYNEGWKNPYYYIKSAFPAQTEFEIRAISYSDNAALCTRLRKEGASSYTEVCRKINLIDAKKEDSEEIREELELNEQKNETAEKTANNAPLLFSGEDFVPAHDSDSSFQQLLQDAPNGKVLLNPQPQKEESYISNEEKIRLGIAYAFAAVCIVLVILMSLRKI